MDSFLSQPENTRAAAIRESAARMKLHPTPVEKDFWVCYLLRELFSLDCVKDHLIFKGGTSLSKAFGLIERFSEDIDLSIHASAFGININSEFNENHPSERSQNNNTLFDAAATFIDQKFIPALQTRLTQSLPELNWRLQPFRRSDDFNIILFHYPWTLNNSAQPHYTTPHVQIEIGVRSEHEPAEYRYISPYIAGHFPQIFTQPSAEVKVLSPIRTFWEKVTIYHAESFKTADQPWSRRYARHAYDLHKLMQAGIGNDALKDFALLERVARHKARFHSSAEVDYHQAYSGKLTIVPTGSRLEALAADYAAMRDFFMAEPPPFEDIIQSLMTIEQQTNSALS